MKIKTNFTNCMDNVFRFNFCCFHDKLCHPAIPDVRTRSKLGEQGKDGTHQDIQFMIQNTLLWLKIRHLWRRLKKSDPTPLEKTILGQFQFKMGERKCGALSTVVMIMTRDHHHHQEYWKILSSYHYLPTWFCTISQKQVQPDVSQIITPPIISAT